MARAQRFYGGALGDWLNMPTADLTAMLDAANVLEARERVARIADGQVAAGLAKKAQARTHLEALRERSRVRPGAAERGQFQELGFEVVRVKRGG